MAKKFTYLVSYDISAPKVLQQVARYLESRGVRLQKSVFILNLGQHQIRQVKSKLIEIIGTEHHVMVIPLCRNCLNKSELLGKPQPMYYLF